MIRSYSVEDLITMFQGLLNKGYRNIPEEELLILLDMQRDIDENFTFPFQPAIHPSNKSDAAANPGNCSS